MKMDFVDWGKNDHIVDMGGHFTRTYLMIPHGLDPTKLYFQAMVWTDETGEVTIKFKSQKGEYEHKQAGIKPKTWTPITVHLSELRNKNVHPEPDHFIDDVNVMYKPLKSRKFGDKELARALHQRNGRSPIPTSATEEGPRACWRPRKNGPMPSSFWTATATHFRLKRTTS